MIAGEVPAPALNVGNRDVIVRHLYAIVFGAADPGLSGKMVDYVSGTGQLQEEKINDLKFDHWVKEGMSNAEKYVYNTLENQEVSADYLDKSREISKQSLALAGYRLSMLLNQLFL